MALDYSTTNTLLPMLRLLPLMPSVQQLFSDQDLLSILNFEMISKIYPLIDNQTEEYFVTLGDTPYTMAQTLYHVPTRALGGKLRALSFVDPSNNEIRIPRLRPEDIMSNVNATGLAINPALWGFYMQNNDIQLYLSSVNGGTSNYKTLRQRYIRQPNQLVLNNQCGQITAIAGNIVTVDQVPLNFTTAQLYDMQSNVPNFNALQDDSVCTMISGLNMTFVSIPVDQLGNPTLKIGDWICLSGQSPIAQIPYTPGYDLLLQLAAAKCLEIHGDVQGFNVAMSQATDMKNYLISILTPRVDGNVIRLTTPNSLYGWD
jgi:hypothetical protein